MGQELAIGGIPAVPFWRKPAVNVELGRCHHGFKVDDVPLARLHGR